MRLQESGLTSAARAALSEPAPVVTGKTDDKTIRRIFKGWTPESPFNPEIELEVAASLRDAVVQEYNVFKFNLAGEPRTPRQAMAQMTLAQKLHNLRGWSKRMIEKYLDANFPNAEWLRTEVTI